MDESNTMAPDDKPVRIIELAHASGLRLSLMDWGATWLACDVPVVPGSSRQVLLGCGRFADWFAQTAYFGATVGRYANRIGNARFTREGRDYVLVPNRGSAHQLHGGPEGFSARRWKVLEESAVHVVFGIESPDGDQGYPGNLTASVTYRLEDELRIAMEYSAQVDAPCPVNLTNHAYFNLDGHNEDAALAGDILAHRLQIRASHYLPTDDELIPLGQLASVAGTSFDFREAKAIGADILTDQQQMQAGGYDHAWLLDPRCKDMSIPAATLTSSDQALSMDLFTTMPALQFYSGNVLAGTPDRRGGVYDTHQGLALETQFLPDSPNHPDWPQPSCWLLPGQIYRQRTDLRFRQS